MLCVCHTTPTQKLFCLHVFCQAGPPQRVDCLAPRWEIALIACLHDQSKSGFFGRPAFSSQSGLFENFSDCSDWLDKSWPSKKANFVLIM